MSFKFSCLVKVVTLWFCKPVKAISTRAESPSGAGAEPGTSTPTNPFNTPNQTPGLGASPSANPFAMPNVSSTIHSLSSRSLPSGYFPRCAFKLNLPTGSRLMFSSSKRVSATFQKFATHRRVSTSNHDPWIHWHVSLQIREALAYGSQAHVQLGYYHLLALRQSKG